MNVVLITSLLLCVRCDLPATWRRLIIPIGEHDIWSGQQSLSVDVCHCEDRTCEFCVPSAQPEVVSKREESVMNIPLGQDFLSETILFEDSWLSPMC